MDIGSHSKEIGHMALIPLGNSTISHDDNHTEPRSLFGTLVTGILLSLVIVATLIGNSLVCAAVASVRRLRSSVTNYFVVSLAVADLTVAILVMPYAVSYEMHERWLYSWIFCYFWISCDVTCCTASILHLCIISVDRYIAINDPLTYRTRMSRQRALALILAAWLCSMAISFVPVYAGWFADTSRVKLYVDSDTCGLYVNRIYALVSSMTSFYVPLVVMIIVYVKIFGIARKQADEIRYLEQSLSSQHSSSSVMHSRLRRRSRRLTDDSKAIKTLGTIMGLFCVCWLPFFLVYVLTPFFPPDTIHPAAVSAVTWLGYANSFINPCVYAWLNRDFRTAFRKILFCWKRVQNEDLRRSKDATTRTDVTGSRTDRNGIELRGLSNADLAKFVRADLKYPDTDDDDDKDDNSEAGIQNSDFPAEGHNEKTPLDLIIKSAETLD